MPSPTTANLLPPAIATSYANKTLQSRTRPLIHTMGLNSVNLKIRNGNTIRHRRFDPLNWVTTPLGKSGATPDSQLLKFTNIDAEVEWYGSYSLVNEQVVITNQDPILNIYAEMWGKCMKESDDILARDVLASTVAFQRCVYGKNGDVPSDVSAEDLTLSYTMLKSNDAFPVSAGKEGADKFGSAPVHESYFALCHTNLIPSLNRVTNFTRKINYPNQTNVLDCEHGAAEGFRFFVSSIGSVDPIKSVNAKDIYNIIQLGKDAAARVSLGNNNAEFIYKKPQDALNQNFTCGIKWIQVTKILNDSYMNRLIATL